MSTLSESEAAVAVPPAPAPDPAPAPAPPASGPARAGWVAVCTWRQLVAERGVAVLVGDRQVALFRVRGDQGEFVYAVGHRDPFSGAHVMARGIVGSTLTEAGERDTVASPMYKDVFDLATGACLADPAVRLPVHRTWVAGGVVYVEREPRWEGADPAPPHPGGA